MLSKICLARIRERAIGAEVSKALNPGQQVIKIVNEELVQTLGEAAPLNLKGAKPRTIMMVGFARCWQNHHHCQISFHVA